MNERQRAQSHELESLAKLLFDDSVRFYFAALILQFLAGIIAVIVSFVDIQLGALYVYAVVGFILLAIAYVFRIFYQKKYDLAETMRRQAVFANGLGWDIDTIQFSEWRRIAGERVLERVKIKPLPKDYYSTKAEFGKKRLLQLTKESAFWTRHLYKDLRIYAWIIFLAALILLFVVLSITSSSVFSQTATLKLHIAYAVFLALPLVLTIDVLWWAIRFGFISDAIYKIEADLDRLESSVEYEAHDVIRLVSEYNCQLIQGFPIPKWFFESRHDYIQKLWDKTYEVT